MPDIALRPGALVEEDRALLGTLPFSHSLAPENPITKAVTMNFPAASTVLVFNVGSEPETSTAPPQAPITVPTALPAPAGASPAEPEQATTKEERMEELLAEVGPSVLELGKGGADWDVAVPDATPAPTEPLKIPRYDLQSPKCPPQSLGTC